MFKDIINQMFLNNMLNVFEFWRLFLLFCFSLSLSKLFCLNYHFYILPFDFVSTQIISALSISVIFVAFLYRILISFHKCLFNIQSVFSVRKTIASCNVTLIFIFLTQTRFSSSYDAVSHRQPWPTKPANCRTVVKAVVLRHTVPCFSLISSNQIKLHSNAVQSKCFAIPNTQILPPSNAAATLNRQAIVFRTSVEKDRP